ncbi:hypothetical protein MMPV_009376 [Pyropia vietnamensis]
MALRSTSLSPLRPSSPQSHFLCLRSLIVFLAGLTAGASVTHWIAKSPPPPSGGTPHHFQAVSSEDSFHARPPPSSLSTSARPAGVPGGVASRGRQLPTEDEGCAALRQRFIFYNRPPKTGSTSLRSALRAVARRCGLVELPCHRHAAPNTVGLAGALQLAGCGAVLACHVADRPGVRAAVDRAASACAGGGIRLTSVRGLAGRDAAWLLQTRNAYAQDTAAVSDAEIRAGLAVNAGDSLAAYFGLLPQPPGANAGEPAGVGWGWGFGGGGGVDGGSGKVADVGVGGTASGATTTRAGGSRWSAPLLSREGIVDHLLWYDALVDLTDDAGGEAARLLSAVLGVRVEGVAKENARTHAAFVARVGRLRNETRPMEKGASAGADAGVGEGAGAGAGGGVALFPDEALYAVAREMYRHQVWFTVKGGTFDELTDAFVD